jgi:hypothetical protein
MKSRETWEDVIKILCASPPFLVLWDSLAAISILAIAPPFKTLRSEMSAGRDVNTVGASFGDDKEGHESAYVTAAPPNPEDPAAPSTEVSSKRQRISDLVTIIAAGAGLASDG